MLIREYRESDLAEMIKIWNGIVGEGNAFPYEDMLDESGGADFFRSQSHCGVAIEEDAVVGLYTLHPNNVGRCGHICNASYVVSTEWRGRHIGEQLVKDSLSNAERLGFKIMQFNAVIESNLHARHLYERLGFIQLGTIQGGFRMKDGHYENICPYYREL